MLLAQKRVSFTQELARLLYHAQDKGRKEGFYPVIGRVKMPAGTPGQHPRSCHINGLAAHIILYDRDFNWLHEVDKEKEEKIYRDLHMFWEFLGGAELIEGDLNHFSFEFQGVR